MATATFTEAELRTAGEKFLETEFGKANFKGPVLVEDGDNDFTVTLAASSIETRFGVISGNSVLMSLDPADPMRLFAV